MKKILSKSRGLLYIAFAIFLLTTNSDSQAAAPAFETIKGMVRDADSNPLSNVSVIVKGTSRGGVTAEDGSFGIEAALNDTLVFSISGYQQQEVIISDENMILQIVMVKNFNDLDEVVVVGYGTQKKSVVTGAISSVKASDFANQQTARIEQVLQGRTSGLTIAAASGAPGAVSTVRVRGITSLNDGASNPLFVVDGVVVDNGSVDYLSSNDIESIEVLKDAASAAIYGARASAGVILITTKKGKQGGIVVNYNGYLGTQKPERKLDLLNAKDYATLINEQSVNGGGTAVFDNPESLETGTDWQALIFNNNAKIQNHELSFSGGFNKSSFYSSVSYFDQDGIVASDISNFKRISLRLNSIHKIRDWLTFGQNLGYSHIKSLLGVNANTEFQSPLSSATNLDPITPVTITDPDLLSKPPYSNQPVIADAAGNPYGVSTIVVQQMVNPLALIKTKLGNHNWSDDIVGNAFLEIKPISAITFRSTIGAKLSYNGSENFSPIFYLNSNQTSEQTSFARFRGKTLNWNLENTLAYSKSVEAHDFSVLLGQGAYLDNNSSGMTVTYYGIPATNFDEASMNYSVAAENVQASGYEGILHKVNSLFGRLNYNYDEKYLFTGIIRRDGSSRFGPNNKFGYFPSASVGWVASRENFFPKTDRFNFLKIRGSYGVTGNDVLGEMRYASTVSDGRNYVFGSDLYAIGYSPNAPANPDLKWEETRQLNFGLDAIVFRNFNFTFDWFKKKTVGVLMPVEFPGFAGATGTSYGNVGDIENTGVELELGYKKQVNKVALDVRGNLSYLKNKVSYLGDGKDFTEDGAAKLQSTAFALTRTAVGYAVGSFYGFQRDGIFQNQAEIDAYTGPDGAKVQPNAVPGDFKWVDINGDGKIDADDRTFIGDPTPDLSYGFTINLGWNHFDLLLFGQGVAGNQIYQGLRRLDIPTANWQTNALDRWHGEGTSNNYPRLTTNDVNKNYSYPSDFYLQNGDYFRFKTMQLGYTLPQNMASKIGLQRFRVYASGSNLFTITNYTGFDPEIGGSSFGIDRGIYPQAKSFLLGLNLTF
ncbi:TonB-dependent receptor [Niabella insulamsoli]|uniref:SusC/RagA family TonB-linked outer membrane protein n=1 Tax=Niabella insulamsoli TaxID=3144874 RepID=UPI0031FBBC34